MTKHQKETTLVLILLGIIIIGSLYFYFTSKNKSLIKNNDLNQNTEICKSESREVYGTSYNNEEELNTWKNDCKEKQGVFNECGSACTENAENCIAVCAFTCEEIPGNCQ